jgi:hypothetical protein
MVKKKVLISIEEDILNKTVKIISKFGGKISSLVEKLLKEFNDKNA